jgi:hypothetical protein
LDREGGLGKGSYRQKEKKKGKQRKKKEKRKGNVPMALCPLLPFN